MKKKQVLAELARRGQLALTRLDEPVPSPCISVCRVAARSRLCEGCWRNIDEICAWSGAPEAYKRGVWRAVLQRAGLAPSPEDR